MRHVLADARVPADAAVALAFVSETSIRALNARHRRVDRATDVLSFGQRLPPRAIGPAAAARLVRSVDGSLEVGDIVVSAAQAERQARRRGWSLPDEVAFLAAHGALHLLGYRDDTPAGHREMLRRGREALAAARAAAQARAAGRRTRGRRG